MFHLKYTGPIYLNLFKSRVQRGNCTRTTDPTFPHNIFKIVNAFQFTAQYNWIVLYCDLLDDFKPG